ncbi:MAG: N-acetyltransferase [Flavobacteriaceae bacterium]|nr:N-acetyltransferase [Flavobacteriaceae bacterium]
MKGLELKKNDFQRQFEALVDNELITIEFSEQERKTFLTKMVISEHLIKEGYQEKMIQLVLDFLKENNVKVVPTCKQVKSFMRKNKLKYKDMLPVGIAL